MFRHNLYFHPGIKINYKPYLINKKNTINHRNTSIEINLFVLSKKNTIIIVIINKNHEKQISLD
jgi:hypothetical protein